MATLNFFYEKYKQLIPVLVLILFCLSTVMSAIHGTVIMAGETYDFELTIKHYLAFAAVLINFISFFLFRSIYKYTLLVTVLLGAFNFINFSAFETTWSVNISSLTIAFQPSAFLAGFVTYLINRKKINGYIIDQLKPSPEDAERNAKEYWSESVNKFKERYSSYSIEELNQILAENKYVAEALEAARQLINDRR